MKLADYEAIRARLLSLPCNVYPDMDALKAAHPGVSLDALVSIFSQESSRRIKANHGRHVRGIEAHARRYLSGEDIFALADSVDFPPCQLVRLLLEHLLSLGHKSVGPCLRDPSGRSRTSPPMAPLRTRMDPICAIASASTSRDALRGITSRVPRLTPFGTPPGANTRSSWRRSSRGWASPS